MDNDYIELDIYRADITSHMPLVFAEDGIRAGFPSPGQEYISETIDLNKDLIRHPASTFYGRVTGDSMSGEGISEGDILVIDKSIEPEEGDLAVCCVDGEFTLKRIHLSEDKRRLFLMPSNPKYQAIEITEENEFMVWGVVLYTIKANRRRRPGQRL